MMLSACVIICASFGFVQTVPLNYKNPFFSNYDSVNYNELVRATRNLIPKPALESLFLRPLETRNSNNDASLYREDSEFIRLPTSASDDLVVLDPLPPSSYFENGIQAALPLDYGLITQNVPSAIVWNNKYNLRVPYDMDPDTYEVDQGLNAGSQESDFYPYVHTSIPLNPVPPVHTLPPVYATHIHEPMPSLETRDDYDIDVMNPENSELMPPNLRITRSRRDYLEDLAHDAMLNNLLPTMPVPFVRGTESSPSYQVSSAVSRPTLAQRAGQVMAVYPTSAANDCAIPILMRCSPNIIRGRLSRTYAEQSPQVTSGAVYRDDVEPLSNNAFSQ